MNKHPNLTLKLVTVMVVIIYTNFVELESPMRHVRFQGHRTLGSAVFAIYLHDRHLGYKTKTMFTKFRSPLPKKVPHKNWP